MSKFSATDTFHTSDIRKFRSIYETNFSSLKYFAMRYIKDENEVCDLLQDIFLKLWERGEVFENEIVLKTYLYHAVRNNCLTYLRNHRRRERQMQDFSPEESEEAFVNRIIEAEVYALINKAFEELSPMSKKVYLMSLEGKSHKEIADQLHISVNTIKRHKNIANRYLRGRLEKLICFIAFLG